jgi:hypothetical protein
MVLWGGSQWAISLCSSLAPCVSQRSSTRAPVPRQVCTEQEGSEGEEEGLVDIPHCACRVTWALAVPSLLARF